MIIAVDFDGTLHTGEWPEIGAPVKDAIEIMKRLYADGHVIIINTCREGQTQLNMEDWLIGNEIPYDYVNENSGGHEEYGYNARKIYADVYIDDHNLGGLPPWREIYDIISGKVKPYYIYKTVK